jgi:hypothetical protein
MPILNDNKLLLEWNKRKGESETGLASQHNLAAEAYKFHAGDKACYVGNVQDKEAKRTVVFNKVKPFVDAVTGLAIQLRRKPDYQARMLQNEAQQLASEYMNGISDYARAEGNFDFLETRQDRDMLITGYSAIDTNIVYDENPDGKAKGENVRFNDIYWDINAIEPNLMDARFVYRRKVFTIQEALKRFKGSDKQDFELYNDPEGVEYFNKSRNGRNYSIRGGRKQTDLVEVYCYQYYDLETYFRTPNPLFDMEDPFRKEFVATAMNRVKENRLEASNDDEIDDIFEFDPFSDFLVMNKTVKKDIMLLFKELGVEIEEVQEFRKKVYYTAIISGTKIFQKFKSPHQQGFSIKFKTGTYDPIRKLWYGLVQGLKEPARYATKALTEMLFVIASTSKAGVLYEESAVEDPRAFEQAYATTKAAVAVRDGALSGNKIQPKAQASLPNGYDNIYLAAENSMFDVTGLNREFMGASANKQVSALLEKQRIDQVIATLADYFDSISLYQLEHARLMITFIKMLAENSQNRLVSIIGEDGARRYEVLDENKILDEYDLDVGEAPTTPQQKQETLDVMVKFADSQAQFGNNVYDVVVPYLPIKQSDKQTIIDRITPDSEQQQATAQKAEQAAQLESALNQSLIEANKAATAKSLADAEKSRAGVEDVLAQADETRANTAKLLGEAEQKAVENEVLKAAPAGNVTVNI